MATGLAHAASASAAGAPSRPTTLTPHSRPSCDSWVCRVPGGVAKLGEWAGGPCSDKTPLARADDASGHQLRHRLPELLVRHHGLLRLLGVLLHLLQEHVDLGVVQDLLDLGVRHRVRDLLLIHLAAPVGLLNGGQHLLPALRALVVVRVQFEACLVGLQGLVILFHEEVGSTLPRVRLHERRVQLQALVQVSQSVWVREQLRQCGCAIGVELGICWIPLDCLVVLTLSFSPFLLLEEVVALPAVLLGLVRVQVAFLLKLLLSPLELPQRVPRLPVVVLCQRLVVILNGLTEILLLLVNGCHPREHLRNLLEGRTTRVRTVDLISSVD
mmetsp:Transcript_4244/g.12397  ORF Transcript_4244/g.12397 Transcript_4244/m.12397 type:complete len:328 (+) Transcript_4244:227-1210(+)